MSFSYKKEDKKKQDKDAAKMKGKAKEMERTMLEQNAEKKIKERAVEIWDLFVNVNKKISSVFDTLEAVEKTALREQLCGPSYGVPPSCSGVDVCLRFNNEYGIHPYLKNLASMERGEEYILKIVGPSCGDLHAYCCGYKHDFATGPLQVINGLIDGDYIDSCGNLEFDQPPLIDAVVSTLNASGERWSEVAETIKVAMLFGLYQFYKAVSAVNGNIFDDPETTRVVEEYKKEQELKKLRSEIAEAKKQNGEYVAKVENFKQRLSEKAGEISKMEQQLAEVRREQKTKEEIAQAMAETLAAKSELALANLKLAVQKAVADLMATKGISKSRRFAQIRKELEAAIYPPAPATENYDDDREDGE